MAGDEGKKVNGDEGSSEQIEGELAQQIIRLPPRREWGMAMDFDYSWKDPRPRGPKLYDLVSEEETAASYVYKMDKPRLTADEVRVEIRRGHALWVIGRGDEPVKVELRKNSEMRVREATASMSPDGVLTIMIPKRQRPRKWYKFTDLVFLWFKTVHVGISS